MSTVLFDSMSWLNANKEDYVNDFLDCTGRTEEEYENREQLLEAVSEWLQSNVEWDWEDFKGQCKGEKGRCLVTGYFMSWHGPLEGGKIYKDLETAVQNILLDDSHPIFSFNDEGVLVLDETHHDAPSSGNHYEFRILTAKGESYYDSHNNIDRQALCEALRENGRSRNVKTEIFGF